MSAIEVIRPATSSDIAALGILFREVFGVERPESIWRWKYFDNPRGCASYVCDAGGVLVAHCGGTAVMVDDGGIRYPAFQSVDFMSSPAYPGGVGKGGVFVRTAEAFFRRYCSPDLFALVYGFPGERHRRLGERVLGYTPIEQVGELRLEPSGSLEVARPLRRADLPLFVRSFSPFSVIRDDTYLSWRYLDHPLFRYEVVLAGSPLRGNVAAAIVLREGEDVHLMELGGRLDPSSLRILAGRLSSLGAPVRFWCSLRHPLATALTVAGFVPTVRDHSIECRSFAGRLTPPPGGFYFTLGDYDVW